MRWRRCWREHKVEHILYDFVDEENGVSEAVFDVAHKVAHRDG